MADQRIMLQCDDDEIVLAVRHGTEWRGALEGRNDIGAFLNRRLNSLNGEDPQEPITVCYEHPEEAGKWPDLHFAYDAHDEITRLRAEVERLRAALDYRTDLNRVTYDDDGHLDEIVTDGGAHLENLGENRWFLDFHRGDGSSVALWISGRVSAVEERGTVTCPKCNQRPILIDQGMLACECGWSARAALHEGRQDADG